MNQKLFSLLSLLLVIVSFSACNRDREEEVVVQTPPVPEALMARHPAQDGELPQHQISINIEPSIRMGDLRAMGLSYDEGLRAVVFDTSGNGLKVQASDDNWKTYIFFRKKGDDINVGYTSYEYEQGERVTYVEGGVTKSKIILRPKELLITLTGVPLAPEEGEEWYIAGITGGGTLNPETMSVSYSPYYNMGRTNPTREVPFTFDWTPLTFTWRDSVLLGVAKPTFKPRGTLIKASIKNTFPHQIPGGEMAIHPPMTDHTDFLFSAEHYTDSDVETGAAVRYDLPPPSSPAMTYKVYYSPWEAGETKTFLIWGMPHPSVTETRMTPGGATGIRYFNTSTGKYGEVLSRRQIQPGKFYRLNIELRRPPSSPAGSSSSTTSPAVQP